MVDINELDAWRDVVLSDNWVVLKDLLESHKEHLEKQVIISVSQRDFEEAYRYEARLDECKKIVQLVEGRLKELSKGDTKE